MNPLLSFLGKSKSRKTKPRKAASSLFRPRLEALDDRIVPTHFRYGNLDWAPTPSTTDSPNAVHFDFQQAYRIDFPFGGGATPTVVGSIVSSNLATLVFGDGTTANVSLRVLSVNTAENWFLAESGTGTTTATFVPGFDHVYATSGPYTAFMLSNARISTLQNNHDGDYRVETTVNTANGNASPVSSIAPIVQVQDNTQVSFQIPGFDPNGDPLTFRLATSVEASGSTNGYVQPTGLSVSPSGLVTWNLLNTGGTATNVGDLWTTQIIIEDHVGTTAGAVKSKIPIDFILQVVPAANQAPVISATPSGPFQPVAGQQLSFVVNATDPDVAGTITALQALNAPSGMTLSTFVAGNSVSRTVTWTPTQAQANQNYVITFQATDNQGATKTTSVTISPTANLSPTAIPGGPYTVNEGGTVLLTGGGTDPENGPLTYAWDLDGNGTFETPGQNVTFSAAGMDGFVGSHRHVTLQVTDNIGNVNAVETEVEIVNVPPVLDSLTVTPSVNENGTVTLSGTYHDAGTPDTHTLTINWGEGAAVTLPVSGGTFSFTHQYLDDNPTGTASDNYTIGVTLTDKDGDTATGSTSTTVNNVAPVLDTIAVNTVSLSPVAHLVGTYYDVGTQDTHTLSINWGDGTQSIAVIGGSFDISHTYAGAGIYPVSVTLTDDDNGSVSSTVLSANIVLNSPPSVAANNAAVSTPEGTPASNSGTFSDPQGNGTVTLSASVGTITQDNGLGTWSWSAPAPDDLAATTVTITATDSSGATATTTFTYAVTNVAPTAIFNAPATANEGSVVAISLLGVSDPSSVDTTAGFTYAFDTGSGYGAFGPSSSIAFTPADNGTVLVKGKVMDKDGGVTEYTANVIVNNVAPTATFNAPATASEGSPISISITGVADPSSTDATAGFTYAFDTGSGYGAFGASNSATFTPADNGTVTVKGKVMDKDGGVTEYTATVIVANVAPTATFNAPVSVNEGSPISVSITGVSDASSVDATAGFTYAFDTGSGYGAFGASNSATFTPADNGTVTVKGKVMDKDGGVTEYTASVIVANVAPTATIGNNGPVNEGSPVTVSLTNPSDPSPSDTTAGFHYSFATSLAGLATTYAGATDGASKAFSFGDSGTTTVYARIFDVDGGYSDSSTVVTVNNVAPTATIGNSGPVNEGSPATVSLTNPSDPSPSDTTAGFHYSFATSLAGLATTYAGATDGASKAFTLGDNGAFTVYARIFDVDGGYSDSSTVVTVNNVAPVLNTLTATSVISENGIVTLSGTYSDAGTLDTHTLTINWGEGSPQVIAVSGNSFTVTHQYLDDNPTGTASDNYTIGVTLKDDDGGTTTATRSVTVNNVAPVLGTVTVVTPESGNTFTLTGSFTDVGKADTHTALINWGDGTAATPAVITESNGVGTINATHVYGAGTVFTVTVTLTDDDTGTATATTKAFNYYVGPSLIAVSRYISSTSSAIDWISPTGDVLWSIPVPSPSVFGVPQVAGVTDRNGDGVADVYIGSQAGLLNRVGLVDGKTGALLWNAAPYVSTLKLGVNVAVGDLTGDRKPELIVAPAGAATPNVRAFQQTAGAPSFAFSLIRDFYAYASNFTGGVNVAVGDVNGDGLGDIITGTAANSDNVRVFSAGLSTAMIADFFAFNRTGVIPGYIGGVSVAAGDVNGDNYADLITSTQTQYSRVRVYSGGVNAGMANTPNALLLDFTTYAANIGVLAMARDLNGDGKAEVVTLTQTVGSVLINAYGYTGSLAPSTVMTKTYSYKPSGVRLG